MAQVNLDNALESGRHAIRRLSWLEAYELLSAADQGVHEAARIAQAVQVVTISWK